MFDNRLACRTQVGTRYGRTGQLVRALWRMSTVQGRRKKQLRLLSYHTDAAITQAAWDTLCQQIAEVDDSNAREEGAAQQRVQPAPRQKAEATERLFPLVKAVPDRAPAADELDSEDEEKTANTPRRRRSFALQELPPPLLQLLRGIEQLQFTLGGAQHRLSPPLHPVRLTAPSEGASRHSDSFMLSVSFRCRPVAAAAEASGSSAGLPVVRLQMRLLVHEPVLAPNGQPAPPSADSMRRLRERLEYRLKQFRDGFFTGGMSELLEGKTELSLGKGWTPTASRGSSSRAVPGAEQPRPVQTKL